MTGEELKNAGIVLYGKRWKAPLARRLQISPVTIWRYARMQEIPERTAIAVKHFLERHEIDTAPF